MKRILIATGLMAMATSVWAAEVPHTFVPGATASADEVNANFNAVANAAEDNSYNVQLVTDTADANATAIAELQAANAGSNSPALNFNVFDKDMNNLGTLLNHNGFEVTYITNTGYIFNNVNVTTGKQSFSGSIFYKSTDCTWGGAGQSQFTPATHQGPGTMVTIGGQMYYVSKTATPTSITVNSRHDGTACSKWTQTGQFYRLTANDPAVTAATVSPEGGATFTFSK